MPRRRGGAPPEPGRVDRRRLEEFERGLDEARQRQANLPAPSERREPRSQIYHPADEHQSVFALLGGSTRRGNWEPAARIDCTAIMGGVNLDLREADLIEGTTTIRCFAFWGGINIIVPPDVDVEADGTGIAGGFDHMDYRAPDSAVPTVRVEGVALMGGVTIRVKERRKRRR